MTVTVYLDKNTVNVDVDTETTRPVTMYLDTPFLENKIGQCGFFIKNIIYV